MKRLKAFIQSFALLLLGIALALLRVEFVVHLTGSAPEVIRIADGRYRLSHDPEIGDEPILSRSHGLISRFLDTNVFRCTIQ